MINVIRTLLIAVIGLSSVMAWHTIQHQDRYSAVFSLFLMAEVALLVLAFNPISMFFHQRLVKLQALWLKDDVVSRVRLKIIGNMVAFVVFAVAGIALMSFGIDYAGAIESWISTASIVIGVACGFCAFFYQPWSVKAVTA
jgi:hypothetical protein